MTINSGLVTDEMKEKYPEHVKLMDIADDSQAVGAFLDSTKYRLCYWNDDYDEYFEVNLTIQQILAEHYGINEKKLEAEKMAMVEEMREANQ